MLLTVFLASLFASDQRAPHYPQTVKQDPVTKLYTATHTTPHGHVIGSTAPKEYQAKAHVDHKAHQQYTEKGK